MSEFMVSEIWRTYSKKLEREVVEGKMEEKGQTAKGLITQPAERDPRVIQFLIQFPIWKRDQTD